MRFQTVQLDHPAIAMFLCALVSCHWGCKKEPDPNEARIKQSISTVQMQVGASTKTKGQLMQKVLDDLHHTSIDSLKKPHLSAIVLWGAPENPRAEFWWIEDQPTADGIILRWPGNLSGAYLGIPQELLNESMIDKAERQLVSHASGVPLAPYIRDGLKLPTTGIEAALAKDGKPITAFIDCPSFLQTDGGISPQTGN